MGDSSQEQWPWKVPQEPSGPPPLESQEAYLRLHQAAQKPWPDPGLLIPKPKTAHYSILPSLLHLKIDLALTLSSIFFFSVLQVLLRLQWRNLILKGEGELGITSELLEAACELEGLLDKFKILIWWEFKFSLVFFIVVVLDLWKMIYYFHFSCHP